MQRLILVILANDAVKQPGRYISLGPNSLARIKDVVLRHELVGFKAPVVWVFGAGADLAHAKGATLAELNEAELRRLLPAAETLVNHDEREAYGTFEEIEWVVKKAEEQFPEDELFFFFFSQTRHLKRVRVIIKWFFRGISASYFETVQTKEIPWVHELRAYGKLLAIKCGLRSVAKWLRLRIRLRYDDA